MPSSIFLDNDVIIKLCLYALPIWEGGGLFAGYQLNTLAASRYVLPKQLDRMRTWSGISHAKVILSSFLEKVDFIEPVEEEVDLAAKLEMVAQRTGLFFNSGESQLLALLVGRIGSLLVTGDKKAICSVSQLAIPHPIIECAMGRIACLEQLFAHLIATVGGEMLRKAICNVPQADRTLSICFCCYSFATSEERYRESLRSYIEDLRANAGGTLLYGEHILPVTPEEDSVGRS